MLPNRSLRQSSIIILHNDLRDEIEKQAQRRAYERQSQGGGTGSTLGGAVLGGLLGGPFGALFGAQIGASLGAASTLDKARKDEMKRKGLTPEMLEQATDIGVALRQAVEGLREEYTTSQGSSRTIFAGANFLPAKQNRASPRGEHLANLPLGAIITIRPLHALRLAILKESLTTPLGRCHPFWLI